MSSHKRTAGEELFLVYLKRRAMEDIEDDIEVEEHHCARKRSRSIGQELYEVHLKRSQGMNPNEDLDMDCPVKTQNTVEIVEGQQEKK